MNLRYESNQNSNLLDHVTLIVWLLCLTISVAGFAVPYPWPRLVGRDPVPPVQAIHIALADESALTPPDAEPAAPTEAAAALPPPPEQQKLPDPGEMPALAAVAAASPAIAFPVPTSAPITEIDSRVASSEKVAPSTTSTASQPISVHDGSAARTNQSRPPAGQPQRLTFGRGEGRQPAPEYPREAAIGGEEGSVTIRFSVDESGRVSKAQAFHACPFPLLNLSALRAVRDNWRFQPGPQRTFEVIIEFKLQH